MEGEDAGCVIIPALGRQMQPEKEARSDGLNLVQFPIELLELSA